jgi:hypothetical protein
MVRIRGYVSLRVRCKVGCSLWHSHSWMMGMGSAVSLPGDCVKRLFNFCSPLNLDTPHQFKVSLSKQEENFKRELQQRPAEFRCL